MDWDRTRIAIRERKLTEILDLSFHVLRDHARPLTLAFALGAAPLALVNWLLVGWMPSLDYEGVPASGSPAGKFRYVWNIAVLVFLQAPAAGVFATAYLSAVVFDENPTLRQAIEKVRQAAGRLVWTLLSLRGALPAMALAALLGRGAEFNGWIEVFGYGTILIVAIGQRAARPFIGEILLLEEKPLRSAEGQTNARQRSRSLHGPYAGELFSEWLGCACAGMLLLLTLSYNFLFLWGVLLQDWRWSPFLLHVGVPLAMWMTALYFCIVRFLSYLNLRIRYEGWEIELRMKTEARRLRHRLGEVEKSVDRAASA